MRKLLFLVLAFQLFASIGLQAQKAKFKNNICTVQKAKLPIHYSEQNQRTYAVFTKGSYAEQIDPYGKRLFGWAPDNEAPSVEAVISIYGYRLNAPQRKSQKKEKKDKDGKVTDSWTEYWYEGSAQGKGSLYVYGLNNSFYNSNKDPKKKSKWQLKQEEKKAEEKKKLESNSFLTEEIIEEAEESDIGTDEGMEDAGFPLVEKIDIGRTKSVETGKHRSASAAYKEYIEKRRPGLVDYRNNYPDDSYASAMRRLNNMYGFAPVNNRMSLKIMKSDKHPEMKTWNDACTAAGTIFKTFKFNKNSDKSVQQFGKIVEYFEGQIKSIPESDKKNQKLKVAAFQNLTKILFYLDQHEKVMTLSEKYLDSKKLDKIAKRALEKSEKQKDLLAFHKMTSCHIDFSEEIADDEVEMADLEEEEESGK